MRRSWWLLPIGLAAVSIVVGWGVGAWRQRHAPRPLERGRIVFQANCASCHGSTGKGDGVASASLNPPPRDFSGRPWKTPLTRESIRRVVLEGIPGTAMPAGKTTLSTAEIEPLVEYVHHLATTNPQPPRPLSSVERLFEDAGFHAVTREDLPKLTLVDAGDRSLDLGSLEGKLVLLHFWGVSCAPCLKEFPDFARLEKEYPGRLAIVHVCVDEDDASAAQRVLDRVAPGSAAYIDANGLTPARFDVQLLPATWLISPTGRPLARSAGVHDWFSPPITALLRHLVS